jgi:hypothetical protein
MTKAPQEEVGTVTETGKAAIHLGLYVVGMNWGGIPQMLFDLAMAALLGVQIRRIGREPFHVKVRMCGHIVLDDNRSVCVQPIPDDAHRPGDVPLAVSQGHKNVRGTDRMRNMARVNLGGDREADHRGSLTAFADAPQDGCLPPRSPGRARLGAKRDAGVIDEDHFRASATSLLFIRAQACVSQAWTRASSRSRA